MSGSFGQCGVEGFKKHWKQIDDKPMTNCDTIAVFTGLAVF